MERDALEIMLDHMEPSELKQAHSSMVDTLKAHMVDSDDFLLLEIMHRIEMKIMQLDGTRPASFKY